MIVDAASVLVAAEEVTAVRACRLAEVDAAHARDESEGDWTVAEWRASHERFWRSDRYRVQIGDPAFTTPVVLVRFRLVDPDRAAPTPHRSPPAHGRRNPPQRG